MILSSLIKLNKNQRMEAAWLTHSWPYFTYDSEKENDSNASILSTEDDLNFNFPISAEIEGSKSIY